MHCVPGKAISEHACMWVGENRPPISTGPNSQLLINVDSLTAQLLLTESGLPETMSNQDAITNIIIDFCYDDYDVCFHYGYLSTFYRFVEYVTDNETDWD